MVKEEFLKILFAYLQLNNMMLNDWNSSGAGLGLSNEENWYVEI